MLFDISNLLYVHDMNWEKFGWAERVRLYGWDSKGSAIACFGERERERE